MINGTKQWITNGERAGVVILFAKTDREDPDTVTQFLVPKDTDGLEVGKKKRTNSVCGRATRRRSSSTTFEFPQKIDSPRSVRD